ncbi:hypothetical protein [Microbulbifer magnicolonia]|uniref:hypothetical protein n=1 Tax=Microbulbifer magnicolonia TaxID=3109744 RepID=UPI002B40F606|nr:hypothetical protein [Microbulbifer sp. GG15]
MKYLKYPLFAMLVILLASCVGNQVGIQKHTGFVELPNPSNIYTSGQIVEIYSSPRKVEVAFDPQIPWDLASTSKGWDISVEETSNIRSKFESEISKILSAGASYNSNQRIQVEFTDTKTSLIPKNRIFRAIDEAINNDSSLRRQLQAYMKDGTHFDVITQTLNATVSFKVIDESNQEITIDSEVIEKLNSEFKVDFSREIGSNRVVSGKNVTVGIHYDPKMISLLTE